MPSCGKQAAKHLVAAAAGGAAARGVRAPPPASHLPGVDYGPREPLGLPDEQDRAQGEQGKDREHQALGARP